MILPRYRIAASSIPGAGKGLFLAQPVSAGSIVVAPDAIPRTYAFDEIAGTPELAAQLHTSVRWFEDRYTLSPDWPDECYVNHSFTPSGLWHLGFIFADANLEAGTELTVDYRHLLAPGQRESFDDATSGQPIVGFDWAHSIGQSTARLAQLLART